MPLGEIIGEVVGNILVNLFLNIVVPIFKYTGAGLRKLLTLRKSDFEYILLLKWNIRIGIAFYFIIGLLFYLGCHHNTKKKPIPDNANGVNQSSTFNKPPEDIKAIDSVIVKKSVRKMFLFEKGKLLAEIKVSLGDNPLGAKHFEGDEKTPEGLYRIDYRNSQSHYYKSLHISYPKKQDKVYAARYNKSPGGEVFIHGLPNYFNDSNGYELMQRDWTDGCIAISNQAMEVIFEKIKNGTPILILP